MVDALVSNTCGKPCRFESGTGYDSGKPLINDYLSGVFSSIKDRRNANRFVFKQVCVRVWKASTQNQDLTFTEFKDITTQL